MFLRPGSRFTASIIMEITYVHQVTSDDDKYIGIAQRAGEETVTAGRFVIESFLQGKLLLKSVHSPGSMLVDFFPFSTFF